MKKKKSARRRFLKGSAALVGGLAAGVLGGLRTASGQTKEYQTPEPAYLQRHDVPPWSTRSKYDTVIRRPFGGQPGVTSYTPLQDLKGIITPADVHFENNHENGAIPDIDPSKF